MTENNMIEERVESSAKNSGKMEHIIALWKQTVNVQMHFNEIKMKIRSLAIAFLVTFLTAYGIVVGKNVNNGVLGIPLEQILLALAAFSWLGFYFLDRFWCQNQLVGVMKHGLALEQELQKISPKVGLANSMEIESPIKVPFTTFKLRANEKSHFFYVCIPVIALFILKTFLVYGAFNAFGIFGVALFIVFAVTMVYAGFFLMGMMNQIFGKDMLNEISAQKKKSSISDIAFCISTFLIVILLIGTFILT